MGDHRRRRGAVVGVEHDVDAVGAEHLDDRARRRLRERVRVAAEEQRAVDAGRGPVARDGLGDGQHVVLVERARRRRPAVARGAEGDALGRLRRVRSLVVVRRDQRADVDQVVIAGQLAGTRVIAHRAGRYPLGAHPWPVTARAPVGGVAADRHAGHVRPQPRLTAARNQVARTPSNHSMSLVWSTSPAEPLKPRGILDAVTPRGTDWSLALLVAAGVASGLATWFAGSPGSAWVYGAHAVAGASLAVLVVVKLRRVLPRLAAPSVAAASLVVLVLGTGVVWSSFGSVVARRLHAAGVARRARRRARRRRPHPRARAREAPAAARPGEPAAVPRRRRGRRGRAGRVAGPAPAAAPARPAGRRSALHRLLRDGRGLPGDVMGRRRPGARRRTGRGRAGACGARCRSRPASSTAAMR